MLEFAWGSQLAAFGIYFYGLGRKKGESWKAGAVLAVAWLAMSFILGERWVSAGLAHPPWVNPYESLLFFSWTMMTVQLVAELKLEAHTGGLPATALAAAASGTAVFVVSRAGFLGEPIERLAPLFRNPWVWVHAPSGALGYGFLLMAVFFASAGVVRTGVATDRILSALAGVSVLVLSGALVAGLATGFAVVGFAVFLTLAGTGFWLEARDRRLHAEAMRKRSRRGGVSPAPQMPTREGLRKGQWVVFAVATLSAALAAERGRLAGMPFVFLSLAFMAAIDASALVLLLRRKRFEEAMPEPENLDRWSYLTALYAFPWLTIHLVSGSVWAYDAWGSYWSWGPQAWVFIVWLYLALMLHLDRGKPRTAVATCACAILVWAALAARGAHGFVPAP